jgi:hypothetical protein
VRALRLLPCALLVVVASHQIALAHIAGLSPWAGGGFGMFSTTDAAGTRHLHAFALRPGLRREIPPDRLPRDAVARALALPSPGNLERLAAAVTEVPTRDHGVPESVEIQVWRTRYDPNDRTPESRLLRGLTLPVGRD